MGSAAAAFLVAGVGGGCFALSGNRKGVVETGPDVPSAGTPRDITYVYDDIYRLTAETTSDRQVQYSYDAVGNRQTMRYRETLPNQNTRETFVQYFYDEHDRLVEEQRTATVALGPAHWRQIAGHGHVTRRREFDRRLFDQT